MRPNSIRLSARSTLSASSFAGLGLALILAFLLGRPLVPPVWAAHAMPSLGGTVAACDETALRAALAGGGIVTFATGDCTITLVATILITAPTTIDGAGQNVTLDGGGAVRIISTTAEVGTLTLQNITLTQGSATSGAYPRNGGALFVHGDLVLSNTTIVSNTAENGGGGAYITGTLTATNSHFLTNTTAGDGGGAQVLGFATLHGGAFENNSATSGGGAYAGKGLVLSGTRFISNSAVSLGGGAYAGGATTLNGGLFQDNRVIIDSNHPYLGGGGLVVSGTLDVTGTQFLSNSASNITRYTVYGGGAYAYDAVTLDRGLFQNNSSGFYGGGLYTRRTLVMTGTLFISNSAEHGGGAFTNGTVTFGGGLFEGNSAKYIGGGLFTYSELTLTGTQFVRNAAMSRAGASVGFTATLNGGVFQNNNGGGLSADILMMTDTQFLSNTATNGSGASVRYTATLNGGLFRNNANANGFGGGLYVGRELALTGTQFISNSAGGAGGGAYVGDGFPSGNNCSAPGSGAAALRGAAFLDNTSGGCGGGLYAVTSLAVAETQFHTNRVGLSAWGGGAYAGNVMTVSGGSFQSNSGGTRGGGVFAFALTLTDTRFLSNTAFAGGGAFASQATVIDGVFQNNQSGYDGGGLVAFLNLGMTGTQFLANSAARFGGGVAGYGMAKLTGNLFQDNQSTYLGGGLFIGDTNAPTDAPFLGEALQDDDPARGIFTPGTATAPDAGNFAASPDITLNGTQFFQNRSTNGDGGGLYVDRTFVLTGTVFQGNTARGGGGFYQRRSTGRIVNTLFAGNTATSTLGVAVALSPTSSVEILHTTIASPTLANGAAIAVFSGTVGITNTIIASHSVGISRTGGSVYADYNLFFSNLTNTIGVIGGAHDVGSNPAFVNPAAGDYHLGTGSAAIDAGADAGVTTDFEGDSRPHGAGFDIGFDEATAWRIWLPFLAR